MGYSHPRHYPRLDIEQAKTFLEKLRPLLGGFLSEEPKVPFLACCINGFQCRVFAYPYLGEDDGYIRVELDLPRKSDFFLELYKSFFLLMFYFRLLSIFRIADIVKTNNVDFDRRVVIVSNKPRKVAEFLSSGDTRSSLIALTGMRFDTLSLYEKKFIAKHNLDLIGESLRDVEPEQVAQAVRLMARIASAVPLIG